MEILDRVARDLLTRRHALWFGAGVSFSSGVPTAIPLRTRILQGLGLSDADVKEFDRAKVPFESFFEILISFADCKSLLDVFKGGRPGLAHHVAAMLAKQSLVRTVITTNFDTLLEEALAEHGIEFELCSSETEFSSIRWPPKGVRVIKIHGTILDAEDLAVTIRKVSARQLVDIRSLVIEKMIEDEDDGGIVIMGYSCSDHFDITPALRGAARQDRQMLYVAHSGSGESVKIAPLTQLDSSNPFGHFSSLGLVCTTERLLEALWQSLSDQSLPAAPEPSANWQAITDSWLMELSARGSGFRSYIGGLVLKAANLWERSNLLLGVGVALGLPDEVVPRALLAMGNNYRDLGQHGAAEATLVKATDFAEAARQVEAGARIFNSRGIVAEDKHDHVGAIALFERALVLSRQTKDRELEGKCHGNLGIAYKNRNDAGDLNVALQHQTLARQIAAEIGDKRSEGRTVGNIGLIYRAVKDYKNACKYYDEAREIAESLGDLLHVAILLHNSGEDLANDDPAGALSFLERSKSIFSALGQSDFAQQSEVLIEWLSSPTAQSGRACDVESRET